MGLTLQEISQLAFVVNDARSIVKAYQQLFNTNPPVILDVSHTEDMTGQIITPYKTRIALVTANNIQIEFIQVLEGRPAIYCDFLKRCGPGLHHLGINVPDIDEALQKAKENDLKILWNGHIYGVRFAYLDTASQLGTILEFIEVRPPKPFES